MVIIYIALEDGCGKCALECQGPRSDDVGGACRGGTHVAQSLHFPESDVLNFNLDDHDRNI